jgi:hypothetical protein
MKYDDEKVWLNARQAGTEDLLDRVTVYRAGMEPAALAIIEAELNSRGISREDIAAHERAQTAASLRDENGVARSCSFCRRPAVVEMWGWHHLWGKVPIFPRKFRYCEEHRPVSDSPPPPRRPE